MIQNHIPTVDTTEPRAPGTLVTHKSRAPIHSLQLADQKCRSDALKAPDVHEQGPTKRTSPAVHCDYCQKKQQVVVVGGDGAVHLPA